MPLAESKRIQFEQNGFFFVQNPFGQKVMSKINAIYGDVQSSWSQTIWPDGLNPNACHFLMVGEPLFQIVEEPSLINMAKEILNCDKISISACGLGDASKAISTDGRPQQQVHWHTDGGPEVRQVSLRTALDRHDKGNAPLRILPGSHVRPLDEVREEFLAIEIATGQCDNEPQTFFARHPEEMEIILDPRWTMVWTPSCWHATGIKTSTGLRRAMAWNYVRYDEKIRDAEAVKYVVKGWEKWSEERKTLWGLVS